MTTPPDVDNYIRDMLKQLDRATPPPPQFQELDRFIGRTHSRSTTFRSRATAQQDRQGATSDPPLVPILRHSVRPRQRSALTAAAAVAALAGGILLATRDDGRATPTEASRDVPTTVSPASASSTLTPAPAGMPSSTTVADGKVVSPQLQVRLDAFVRQLPSAFVVSSQVADSQDSATAIARTASGDQSISLGISRPLDAVPGLVAIEEDTGSTRHVSWVSPSTWRYDLYASARSAKPR